MSKRFIPVGVSVMWVWGIILSGFPSSTPAALGEPPAQVIEGARKEGAISMILRAGFTPRSMERLEREVREKFGVDLKCKFVPNVSMPKELAGAIMEHKTGAVPSYDLMTFSSHIPQGMKAGIFEKVDWKPLITKDTNLSVVHNDPITYGGIIYFTGHQGLIYSPERISAGDVPKKLSELADPKWKGKIGIFNYTESWARWAFALGKEKVLADLRGVLKNGAIQGAYVDMYNRYLLREISLCLISSVYLKMAKDKGVPAAWQSLDIADIREYSLLVRKGAKHPNAAKLVAVYLASPEGVRFTLEESGAGNLYYPGNYEHDIRTQNRGQGIREVFSERKPEILEFSASKESEHWQKEIKMVLDTGGER